MPRTTIASENRPGGGAERPPLLKMSAKDQLMRLALWDVIQLPDGARRVSPWTEWVHTLKAPEIENGVALKKKFKQRDGTEVLRWADDFIGQHICLGDSAIMAERGRDVDNCPTCAAAKAMSEEFRGESYFSWDAEIRYAMNVILYSTRPGAYELAQPIGAQILVWAFGASRFNRLDDISRNLANAQVSDGQGGVRPKSLMDVDIALGPCSDVNFQRYDINALEGSPGWTHPEVMRYLQQLWFGQDGANRYGDTQLQAACGRLQTNRVYLDADIRKGMDAWRIAFRGGAAAPSADPLGTSFNGAQGQQDMAAGLTGLAQTAQQSAAPAPVGPVDPFAPAGQALQQAAAPELQQMAAAQHAVLAAAGAPVDPFGGAGLQQFAPQQAQPAAPVQPTQAVPPTAPAAASVTAPTAPAAPVGPAPTQLVPGAAVPTPPAPAPATQTAPADPFAVAPPTAPAPAQENGQSPTFDQLMNFGQ